MSNSQHPNLVRDSFLHAAELEKQWLSDLCSRRFNMDVDGLPISYDRYSVAETTVSPPEKSHVRHSHRHDVCVLPAAISSISNWSKTSTETINSDLRAPSPAFARSGISPRHSFSSSVSTLLNQAVSFPEGKDMQLPRAKKHGRIFRNLRWTLFPVYHRLYVLALLANVVPMLLSATGNEIWRLPPTTFATAVAANITVTILIRSEFVINLLFSIFGLCPVWVPLRIRRLLAKVYHFGGIHSGAGTASAIWFGMLNISTIRYLFQTEASRLTPIIMTLMSLLDMLLIGLVAFSHPWLRARFHNMWEAVHRFAGWAAVIVFWIWFGLMTCKQMHDQGSHTGYGRNILGTPVFWLLVVVSMSLAMPWIRLRKVEVHPEPLSQHAVRLHFNYTNLPLCAAPRLSDSPMKEWHSFAGIPEVDGVGFSVLVSKAGDWTTKVIQNPPNKLWVRGIPVIGVLHVAPIFRRIVLVATGSGIGPVMSLLNARSVDCRILWSTPDPIKTYGQIIIDKVLHSDPSAVIINTSESGRPNIVAETYKLYAESGAEAVFVISNPKVSRKVVYGLESRGIPTFAPIFDS